MPHSLTLQINPENFNPFEYKFLKFLLSSAQKNVMQELKKAREDISRLKKQNFLEFTAGNEFHISRGAAYAITETLQERFKHVTHLDDLHAASEHKKISLEDLQEALENNYQIKDKEILSRITLSLVEPVWVHGSLSVLALSILLPTDHHCSNLSGNSAKQSGIQVNAKNDSNSIEFGLNLHIMDNDLSNFIKGSAAIWFSIEKSIPMQVKLLPIKMQLDFSNKEKSEQFEQKLANNFKDWLIYQNELDDIPIKLEEWRAIQVDFWVFPILIGFLVGLIAMISLIALSLTPISPLLVPPLGLALGLGLASLMNTYAYLNIKKEQEKPLRPIQLSHRKPIQTATFFNHRFNTCMASELNERAPTTECSHAASLQ